MELCQPTVQFLSFSCSFLQYSCRIICFHPRLIGWCPLSREILNPPLQGLSVPITCIGSGDPVRVLHLYTTNTLDIFWSIYCWGICTTCRYRFVAISVKMSRCQDDIFPRIELIPSFVLSSDNTNCKNDIQLFHQLFDELSVHTDYH